MALKERIEEELKKSIKEKDDFKRDTLRFLISAIKNKEIEKRGNGKGDILDESELVDLLRKELKKRNETAAIYKESGRVDLCLKEEKEADIIKTFLPQEMEDSEIEAVIEKVIKDVKASSLKDIGMVIKETLKIVEGKASPSRVAELTRKKLS